MVACRRSGRSDARDNRAVSSLADSSTARPRRASGYAVVLGTYFGARLLDAWFIVVAARRQVPMTKLPPGYHAAVATAHPAGYRDVVTNWDGQWYWDIVLRGYPNTALDASGHPAQTSLAFYPLYPQLCRLLMGATRLPFDIVAPLLSLLLGAAAFVVLFSLLTAVAGRPRALLGTAILSCFVSAPVFQIAYTESLALLLVTTTLLLLRREQYLWALVPVALLGLTRNITLVLVPVMLLHWVVRSRQAGRLRENRIPHWRVAVLVCATGLSATEWPVITAALTGQPKAYFDTLKAWPGFTASPLSPPWLGLIRDAGPAGWVAAGLLVAGLAAVLIRRSALAWGPELWGWAAAYPLYILLATGVSMSILRYSILAFPFVLTVAGNAATQRQRRLRLAVSVAVCVAGLWAQWWWVNTLLVIPPRTHGFVFP